MDHLRRLFGAQALYPDTDHGWRCRVRQGHQLVKVRIQGYNYPPLLARHAEYRRIRARGQAALAGVHGVQTDISERLRGRAWKPLVEE